MCRSWFMSRANGKGSEQVPEPEDTPSSSDKPTVDAAPSATRAEGAHDCPRTNHDPRGTPTIHNPRSTSTPHAHDPRSTSSTTHAHAHEHAHVHDETAAPDHPFTSGSFPHEKLDVYRVALRMAALAKKIAAAIPRGHRNVADHMDRAASNSVLLIAEGANRRGAGEKRQRFVESRGESGEVAAAGDLVIVLNIGSKDDAEELKQLAGRVSAMLTRMIARLQ